MNDKAADSRTTDSAYSPIIVALDTSDLDRAVEVARLVAPHVGMFKIGPELFFAHGVRGYNVILEVGRAIMLDLKLHDIPTTMSRATTAIMPLNPYAITVHAAAGAAAISAVREAIEVANSTALVVAVTALTSFTEKTIWQTGWVGSVWGYVRSMSERALQAGANGIVCSPLELARLRESHRSLPLFTPGIRGFDVLGDDQGRTMSAAEARKSGATWIVVGRPVTKAADPAAAALALKTEALNV
jgi:orotidine-5'-phosphate decarboxylase